MLKSSQDQHWSQAPLDSASEESEDGMRLLLLSRVILGKSEIFPRGSTQSCPSSPEFDSGVDDLASPSKKCKEIGSPWMAFPVLIKALSKFLPSSQILIIQKHYKDQENRRVSRSELIQRVRNITGDKLLVHIIKAFGHKAQH
ncbi:unnamed protein product [Eruca vesicaria subsp. sativa]|uniref:RST domain-containing protein n=1 Tax=Eruca vesicaria subsp. sativa TaxID=29727 RepID=A0ABC8M7M0_ERUVS|nr:unnamed protein product [Eruca vesicaria subsp. sativa]